MKKMISLILCLALVCCLFAGCAAKTADDATTPADTSADTAQTDTSAAETETPAASSDGDESGIEYNGKTKLAMFGPLTGDNMQYGIKIRDGAELALHVAEEVAVGLQLPHRQSENFHRIPLSAPPGGGTASAIL